jgi:hypothetical protein
MRSQVGGWPALISVMAREASRVIEPEGVYWIAACSPYFWLNASWSFSAPSLPRLELA